VWNGSTWAPGAVGYVPGSPPPGGFLGNVFYQDNAGNLTFEDAFRYTESTNTLAVENITGTTVTGTGVVKGSNTFGQRYASQAATNRALANTASLTVERYFTVTAEGNGESFNIQSNTPSAGNKIVRKIWYKNEAFEATDVDTWTLLHTFADDTTYASTATKWQEYLDGQSNGTPPFTLALSWEEQIVINYLLDAYSGSAIAVSGRKLREAYTGSAIRVRRASDNTEQDIGFTASGDLDTSALTTFCTGTDCFIRTWYDQGTGGNNLTQTSTSVQPKIYDSSAGVQLENLLAAVLFNGTSHALSSGGITALNVDVQSSVIVQKFTKTSGVGIAWRSAYSGGASANVEVMTGFLAAASTSTMAFHARNSSGGIVQATNATSANQNLIFGVWNSSDVVSAHTNGTAFSTNNVSGATATPSGHTRTRLGANSGTTPDNHWQGTIQEFIIWPSDQSSNRAGIEANINDYYSIY
jgi:hypothetical protein